MDSSSLFGLLLALSFPMAGGNELADFVKAEEYWQAKGVPYKAAAMLAELVEEAAADVGPLVAQLGADSFVEREEAMRKIRAAGPAVAPQLEAAAKSEDAEIADRARRLLKKFAETQSARAERRTMAVRALGELKHRDALPRLKTLSEGRDAGLAAQARRAVARIEGREPPTALATVAMRDEDLALMPRESWAVAQLAAAHPLAIDHALLFKRLAEGLPAAEKEVLLDKYRRALLMMLGAFGNARIDVVTGGIVGTPLFGGDGYGILLIRGHYDQQAIKAQAVASGGRLVDVGGVPTLLFTEEETVYVALVSPERLAIFIGDVTAHAGPVGELLASIKRGKRELAFGDRLTALVSTIDRRSALWGACIIPKEIPFIGDSPIESFTFEIDQDKNKLAATVAVHFKDEAKAREMIEEHEKGLPELIEREEKQLASQPHMKPWIEVEKTIVSTREEKTGIFTARSEDAIGLLLIPLFQSRHLLEEILKNR